MTAMKMLAAPARSTQEISAMTAASGPCGLKGGLDAVEQAHYHAIATQGRLLRIVAASRGGM
jgi:hypothetical protein